jgi:hypothetical protein
MSQPGVEDAGHDFNGSLVWWRLFLADGRSYPMMLHDFPPGTQANPQIPIHTAGIYEPFHDEWLRVDADVLDGLRASFRRLIEFI